MITFESVLSNANRISSSIRKLAYTGCALHLCLTLWAPGTFPVSPLELELIQTIGNIGK
jgi:hypothetical protein